MTSPATSFAVADGVEPMIGERVGAGGGDGARLPPPLLLFLLLLPPPLLPPPSPPRRGVPLFVADQAPLPASLIARNCTSYSKPLVSPVSLWVKLPPSVAVQTIPSPVQSVALNSR